MLIFVFRLWPRVLLHPCPQTHHKGSRNLHRHSIVLTPAKARLAPQVALHHSNHQWALAQASTKALHLLCSSSSRNTSNMRGASAREAVPNLETQIMDLLAAWVIATACHTPLRCPTAPADPRSCKPCLSRRRLHNRTHCNRTCLSSSNHPLSINSMGNSNVLLHPWILATCLH
jgi:hypothetical protein